MADRHPMALFGLLAVAIAGLYLFNLSISPGFTADEVRYTQLSQHIVPVNAISVTGPFLVHPPWTFSRCAVAQHHRSRIRPGAVRADQHQVFSAACCVFTALATGILARDLAVHRHTEPPPRT